MGMDFIVIFASNLNLMPQQTNIDNAQVVPLKEFVDAVFVELNSWVDKESPCNIAVPKCWKNTIIPLAVQLNKLAQTDITVYWWLLREMSEIDICKDAEEYFGKGDAYSLLLNLDGSRSRYILENSVPEHVDELQEAMKAEDLDAFMSRMPVEEANAPIYNVCRVLRRVEDVRKIYKDTLSHAWGEPLGTLFLLTRRLFDYFAASYYDHHRSCDGMAYNFILALCHTPYHGDRDSFSELMNNLGDLWIKGLRMTYLSKKEQMPPLVSQAFFEVLHGDNAELLELLRTKFDGCPESLMPGLIKSEGGWLELEKYSFVYEKMRRGYSKPPYDWKIMPGLVRVYRGKVPEQYRVVDRIIIDNEPIPMEELKAFAISDDVQNKQGVPEQPRELKPLPIPGQIKLFKGNDCVGEFETIPLSFDNKDAFLSELAVVLSNNNFFSRDDQRNFIHAFGGTSSSSESYSKIHWKEPAASLFALCYVLFDEGIKGYWPRIAVLFDVKGNPLDVSNASKFKKGTNRRSMQNHVKKALENIGVV